MSDIQDQILQQVQELAGKINSRDAVRQELSGDINIIKNKLVSIESEMSQLRQENTVQTREIGTIKENLNNHTNEFEMFKHSTTLSIGEIRQVQEQNTHELTSHMHNEEAEIKKIHKEVSESNSKMDSVVNSFPQTNDGRPDFKEHRDNHDELKQNKDTWNRRKSQITDHLLSGLAWAAVVGIGLSIWEFLKVKLGG